MIPYVVVFAVSTVFVSIAASTRNRSRIVQVIFALAAVLSVSILAGIRDFDLGTDILVYGNRFFTSMADAESAQDVIDYAVARGTPGELGYLFLNFVVSRVSTDPHVFYFVLSFLSSGVVLLGVLLARSWGSATVMWLTYLLTAYVESYNLLRQSLALALAILGISLVLRSRYRSGLLVGSIGLLFHNSAIIFIVMWCAATIVHTRKKQAKPAAWAVIFATAVVSISISPLLDLLSPVVSGTTYENYLGASSRSGQAFGIDALYRLVPLIVGVTLLRAHLRARAGEGEPALVAASSAHVSSGQAIARSRFAESAAVLKERWLASPDKLLLCATVVLLTLLAIDLALLPIREISYPFYRILAYFGYMKILAYGVLVNLVRGPRTVFAIGAVGFSAAYFIFIVVIRNQAFYSSQILDHWMSTIIGA